jgi:translation elongation factor EF-G
MPDITQIRLSVPESIEAEVMLQLNRLGGEITSIECEADSRTAIAGTVPQKCVADFWAWLQAYSDGRGMLSDGQS